MVKGTKKRTTQMATLDSAFGLKVISSLLHAHFNPKCLKRFNFSITASSLPVSGYTVKHTVQIVFFFFKSVQLDFKS